ncbi:MAG: hypothetical protein QW430_12220 [Metallosphaera sp.]|uniref:hypothetical protein n=1 Tax=Metallosphaera sp. TaxID=2020860 RepID=UPI0031670572
MTYLDFYVHKSLLNKVNEEAKRLNISDKLLMKAAIIAFIENPSDSIKPLPNDNHNNEKLVRVIIKLSEDIINKFILYAKSKNATIKEVAENAIANFLTLGDEQKRSYIEEEEKRQLAEARKKLAELNKKEMQKKSSTQLQADIGPNSLIIMSFKINYKLYKLLENEAMKHRVTVAEIVRNAVTDFLQKYGNNYDEIVKLYFAVDLFFSKNNKSGLKVFSVKMPAYMASELEKIARQTSVTKSGVIRLAIMNHLNLLNGSVTEQQKITQNKEANDPPDDPPQQNNKDELLRASSYISVPLPEPLYNLLKKYVMLKYNVNKETEIKLIVSNIVTEVLAQWMREHFSESADVETRVQ